MHIPHRRCRWGCIVHVPIWVIQLKQVSDRDELIHILRVHHYFCGGPPVWVLLFILIVVYSYNYVQAQNDDSHGNIHARCYI